MFTDYHNHCLPGIDDGAQDVETSVAMLELLWRQQVDRVAATPHFHRHRQTVADFLARRQESYQRLSRSVADMPLVLGAEVALERGLAEEDRLTDLTLGGSRILLIEMPYTPYKDWMSEEILNIAYRFRVTPLIAHIDRCLGWYTPKELAALLALEGAVFQLNYEALLTRKSLKFVRQVIEAGHPVVFGTDAHNMNHRAPNAYLARDLLKKKLSEPQWKRLVAQNESLLD